jgi:hypothetical protein
MRSKSVDNAPNANGDTGSGAEGNSDENLDAVEVH